MDRNHQSHHSTSGLTIGPAQLVRAVVAAALLVLAAGCSVQPGKQVATAAAAMGGAQATGAGGSSMIAPPAAAFVAGLASGLVAGLLVYRHNAKKAARLEAKALAAVEAMK